MTIEASHSRELMISPSTRFSPEHEVGFRNFHVCRSHEEFPRHCQLLPAKEQLGEDPVRSTAAGATDLGPGAREGK